MKITYVKSYVLFSFQSSIFPFCREILLIVVIDGANLQLPREKERKREREREKGGREGGRKVGGSERTDARTDRGVETET